MRPSMTETALNGVRVLLLEDEAIINFAITDMLHEFGCRVSACMHLPVPEWSRERQPQRQTPAPSS